MRRHKLYANSTPDLPTKKTSQVEKRLDMRYGLVLNRRKILDWRLERSAMNYVETASGDDTGVCPPVESFRQPGTCINPAPA
jgi:hypothetical protein